MRTQLSTDVIILILRGNLRSSYAHEIQARCRGSLEIRSRATGMGTASARERRKWLVGTVQSVGEGLY